MAVRSWYRPSSNPLSRLQSLVTMLSVSLCLIEVFFVSPCSQWAPLYSRGFVQQRQSSCLTLSTTQRKTQDMHSVRYLGTHHKSHTRDLELKNILPQAWSMIFRGNWCHLLFHAPGVFVIVVSWVGVWRLKLFKTQPNFLRPFFLKPEGFLYQRHHISSVCKSNTSKIQVASGSKGRQAVKWRSELKGNILAGS